MKFLICSLSLLITALAYGQQPKNVDFKTIDASLNFDVSQKKVMGQVTYTFEITGKKPDTVYIDAQNMQFDNVKLNGKRKTGWLATGRALKLFKGFKKGKNTLVLNYNAQPKQTLYFVKDGDTDQIWTQGQGKYTSYWLPSFDDVNEKVIFSFELKYDKNFEALANGTLVSTTIDEGYKQWHYAMDKPMSSYLAMVAIGNFKHQNQQTDSGVPLEYYYRPQDSAKFEPTYRYSKQIFDFYQKEIGISYPWGVYRQVPVLDFLYAGMENTTSTIFSQDFVVDSTGYNDRNYINVNAHELAHQWFGDLVTAKSGTHHWLQEGFATYYALLAEQEIFGEDHFYNELYKIAEQLQQASKTDALIVLDEKASSLSFYQKGAWALHILREGVGREAFKTAVKAYLEKYAYGNVDTDEFLAEINKVSGYDTAAFKKRWLEARGFEVQEALQLLAKNTYMQHYFALGDIQEKPFAENKDVYKKLLLSDAFYPLKEEVIFQTADVPFAEKADLIRIAMASGNLTLRQAVARTVTTIPPEFYSEYKSLLYDKSYITREIALNVLFKKFPDKQEDFLNISKKWVGFNDKNLRILWLTLAYTATTYHPELKPDIYAELQGYASPRYESSIRQNALANLLYIAKPDPIVYENLVNATLSHKWQFVKFAKDNIRKLLKKPGYREQFESILPDLPAAEKAKLQQLLNEK